MKANQNEVEIIPLQPKGFEVVYVRLGSQEIFRMRILEAKSQKDAFIAAEDFLQNLGFEKEGKTFDFGN